MIAQVSQLTWAYYATTEGGSRRFGGGLGGLGGGALLGLLLRLGLLGVVEGRLLDRAHRGEELQHAVGGLRALAHPGLGLLGVDDEAGGVLGGLQGVEGADLGAIPVEAESAGDMPLNADFGGRYAEEGTKVEEEV